MNEALKHYGAKFVKRPLQEFLTSINAMRLELAGAPRKRPARSIVQAVASLKNPREVSARGVQLSLPLPTHLTSGMIADRAVREAHKREIPLMAELTADGTIIWAVSGICGNRTVPPLSRAEVRFVHQLFKQAADREGADVETLETGITLVRSRG